jgi:DNA-binding transcriptional MerR regulator
MFQTFLRMPVLRTGASGEMEQRFTSREVVDLTGITPRQLQWWDERGIVVARREGHRRLYSLDDLAEVAVICELRGRGFSLQRVRKVMRFLQKELGKRLVETVGSGSEYHLLTDGTHIYLRGSAQQVIDILKNARQPMFAVCLSDTVRRVQADVARPASSSSGFVVPDPTAAEPGHPGYVPLGSGSSSGPQPTDPKGAKKRRSTTRSRTNKGSASTPARRPVSRAGPAPSASDRRKAAQ